MALVLKRQASNMSEYTFDSHDSAAYSDIFDENFPICRSISGPGLRETISIFGRYMPLKMEGVASGQKVFDWTVPPEWSIRGAQLIGPDGQSVCDFKQSNLHVVNYSTPIDVELSLEELRPHLHSIPDLPNLIPYVTSYYRDNWGFCLPQETVDLLKPGRYRAVIDSSKYPGEVNFATCSLPGETTQEVLLSSYLCHPSMANNELSGPLVLLGLFDRISRWPRRRFTYRFALVPETIGSICFLSLYGDHLKAHLRGGLVLTCLGGPEQNLSYKTSRRTNTVLDQLMYSLSGHDSSMLSVRPFTPIGGSDERQYCSPGFDLPVGQIARTIYGQYKEYHTSGDNKEFMRIEQIVDAVDRIERILFLHEYAGAYVNLSPYGEPQLGKRGLYPNLNSPNNWGLSSDTLVDGRVLLEQILTILSYSDGTHTMLAIAERLGCRVADIIAVIDRLEDANLLKLKD